MKRYLSYKRKMRIIATASVIMAAVLALVLMLLISDYNEKQGQKKDELHKLNIEMYEEMKDSDILYGDGENKEDTDRREEMKNYDFYQKIKGGMDTYVAFFGNEAIRKKKNDSTGWVRQFFETMDNRYTYARGINCGSKGTDALYGYVALNISALKAYEYYDLAVVCYGAYDDPETFSVYYDGLLRSLKNQNPKCEIYCMIEADVNGYNENAETVKKICDLYGGICIDMNEYFESKNVDFTATLEGITPNQYGNQEYLNAIFEVIDENLENNRQVSSSVKVSFATTRSFDDAKFVSVRNMKNTSDFIYEFSSSGKLGIFVYKIDPIKGGNVSIFANGRKIAVVDTRYGSSEEMGIALISTDLDKINRIRIDMGSEANSGNLYGMIFGGAK